MVAPFVALVLPYNCNLIGFALPRHYLAPDTIRDKQNSCVERKMGGEGKTFKPKHIGIQGYYAMKRTMAL